MKARQVRIPDMERYSERAREQAALFLNMYTYKATMRLEEGASVQEATDYMLPFVKKTLENWLFSYVVGHGIMAPGSRLRFNGVYPGYTRRSYEVTKADVPAHLLDIDALVPDLRSLAEARVAATQGTLAPACP